MELSRKFSDSYIHIEKMEELMEKIREKDDISEENKKEYLFKN
jgi:hypothetical protein